MSPPPRKYSKTPKRSGLLIDSDFLSRLPVPWKNLSYRHCCLPISSGGSSLHRESRTASGDPTLYSLSVFNGRLYFELPLALVGAIRDRVED